MTRCIINCDNIKAEVFIYVCIFDKKIPLNESDDNYCRGGGHHTPPTKNFFFLKMDGILIYSVV